MSSHPGFLAKLSNRVMLPVDLLRQNPILDRKDNPSNNNSSCINTVIPHPRFVAALPGPSRGLTIVMFKHPTEPVLASNQSRINLFRLP